MSNPGHKRVKGLEYKGLFKSNPGSRKPTVFADPILDLNTKRIISRDKEVYFQSENHNLKSKRKSKFPSRKKRVKDENLPS